MEHDEARERLLAAAEALYYARGIHAVGMDEVRDRAGVSLARLYRLYPSKAHLVAGYLRARDARWRARLAGWVEAHAADAGPRARLLAVFDWLGRWFAEPDYRGCAFINAWGEIGPADDLVAAAVREHKELFRDYLVGLADGLEQPVDVAEQIQTLAEGAMVTSAILGGQAAVRARSAAEAVLR
ncbi:TetR/AcrR family transcriptional regulator [Actinomycetospora sp. TBRC 11914]|uniref:TetR/AcrR family transcriptional regulator n=1 Tax=Actinomycetospora sp. TBRC 11914 TaxID=2729387 RepID=UPI00145CE6C9|nr:TetR/AcrR family transcriptional regulator [Actinomycetospora sp. TBRC 11914]NMO90941.1 TetR/AcrR family transcriptional regulator [Actinomycetospora sp. TBRC 11914]